MTNDTYNGWTNRETWATNLWLVNSPSSYRQARARPFPDYLRLLVMELSVEALLDIGSLWRVNWDEIAKALSEGEAK